MPVVQSGFTQETFETFVGSRGDPAWLVDLRREAWETFAELPLPNMRQEEWRRTDLRPFRLEQFGLPAPPALGTIAPAAILSENVELGGRVVAVDSRPWSASSIRNGDRRGSCSAAWMRWLSKTRICSAGLWNRGSCSRESTSSRPSTGRFGPVARCSTCPVAW